MATAGISCRLLKGDSLQWPTVRLADGWLYYCYIYAVLYYRNC